MEFYAPPAPSSLTMPSSTTKKRITWVTSPSPTTTRKPKTIPILQNPIWREEETEGEAIPAAQWAALQAARSARERRLAREWGREVRRKIPISSLTIAPPIGGTRKRYKGRKGYKGGKYSRRKRRYRK